MPGLPNATEAFVTLVTNPEYGLGAAVLGYKLRAVGTTRATVVMVTETVPETTRAMLAKTWDKVLDVTQLDSKDSDRLAMLKRPELGITFSKLNVWKLNQYKKVVFVDADTMPLSNIDDLFQYEELSACRDAGWPDCFNTGLFVLAPSPDTYKAIMKRACEEGSFDGGDQGLLNAHFSTWSHGDISKHIPFSYNVNPNASYTYLPAYKHFADQVKMVHFLGAVKPWHYQYADGKVQGQNLTEHTRTFLEEWHKVAEMVKQSYYQPTSAAPYVPPMSTGSTKPAAPSSHVVPDDVSSVLSHITAQIKNKEKAKSSMY